MATRKERYETNLKLVANPSVSATEALVHMYNWSRFEYHVAMRNRAEKKLRKYKARMDMFLEILTFRQEIADEDSRRKHGI